MDIKAARWYGVITLFIVVAISYIDRINIAILITQPDFLLQMGIDKADRASQGLLATAFMVGYGLSAIFFTPFCVALFGVRRSLIYGLILWGVVTFFTTYFNNYGLLLGSRFLLGFSEGPLFSLASSYIKAYFDARENGKPNSIVNMGTGLGLAIGFPFVSFMIASFDWQTSFHVLGLLNVLLGIPLVLAFIHMPKSHVQLEKPKSIHDAMTQVKGIFKGAMHTRHIILITILTSGFLSYLWGSSNWLPAYLKEARGFSLKEMGWLASLPQYAAVAGVFAGGFIIDKLSRPRVPLIFMVSSIGVALSVLLAISSADRLTAAYSLTLANFMWGLCSPAVPSTVQYFSRPEYTASAFGVVNGTASLVAGFMPAIMGWIISVTAGGSVQQSSVSSSFYAGFAALIGTQVIVFVCGWILWSRQRKTVEEASTTA